MRDRVMGFENEFNPLVRDEDGSFVPTGFTVVNFPDYHEIKKAGGLSYASGAWLPNGSRVYIDSGKPEFCTPECRRAKDLVIQNKAGEGIMRRFFPDYKLIKTNVGPKDEDSDLNSSGCHESYLVFFEDKKDMSDPGFCDSLAPFLATRQIIDGAGWVDFRDGSFLLSGRAEVIQTLVSSESQQNRPIVHTKECQGSWEEGGSREWVHHVGSFYGKGWRRLHLIMGDANILEVPIFLKAGTTSLVLSMIEDGCAPKILCDNLVLAMKSVSRDISGKEKLVLLRGPETLNLWGRALSALEVQEIYCEAAKKYLRGASFESEESEAEAWMIHKFWARTIQAVYQDDLDWLLGRSDWRSVKFLIENSDFPEDLEEKRSIDLGFRDISEPDLAECLNADLSGTRLATDAEVLKAENAAPKDTRAHLRGATIEKLVDYDPPSHKCDEFEITWCRVWYKGAGLTLDSPLDSNQDISWFLKHIEESGKKKA